MDSNQRTQKRGHLQCPAIATRRYSQIRKGEDGRVDNSFYDWRYYNDFNSEDIAHPSSGIYIIFIPQSTYARVFRFELKTLVLETKMINHFTTHVFLRSESDSNRRGQKVAGFADQPIQPL